MCEARAAEAAAEAAATDAPSTRSSRAAATALWMYTGTTVPTVHGALQTGQHRRLAFGGRSASTGPPPAPRPNAPSTSSAVSPGRSHSYRHGQQKRWPHRVTTGASSTVSRQMEQTKRSSGRGRPREASEAEDRATGWDETEPEPSGGGSGRAGGLRSSSCGGSSTAIAAFLSSNFSFLSKISMHDHDPFLRALGGQAALFAKQQRRRRPPKQEGVGEVKRRRWNWVRASTRSVVVRSESPLLGGSSSPLSRSRPDSPVAAFTRQTEDPVRGHQQCQPHDHVIAASGQLHTDEDTISTRQRLQVLSRRRIFYREKGGQLYALFSSSHIQDE